MQDESQDGRTRGYVLMRMLMDIGMGVIYIGVSIFILFPKRFGFSGPVIEPPFGYVLAGILIVYGGFRIYRGVKKNYFRS